ncbi:ribonuclease H-like domain-containing protein [Tanacetum coccineum]
MSTHPMVTRAKAGIFKLLERMNCHVTTTLQLPRSHVHAIRDPNWKEAMLDEYNALITNGMWVLVSRLANVNVVHSMWLFKHKFNADGSLNRYQAHLVANGRSQQQGIDCDETFSLVVKPATIRTVLSLVVSRDWPIHQLDVKNAFLHGYLFETVYMHQPPGFVDPNKPDYVCHLQRSLYGLKQAPRAWFQRFASYPTRVGFQHSKTDSSLFVFHRGSDIAYLLLYVDDINLTASSLAFLQRIIASLHNEFAMTDLGSLNYFLGISAQRSASRFAFCAMFMGLLTMVFSYMSHPLLNSLLIQMLIRLVAPLLIDLPLGIVCFLVITFCLGLPNNRLHCLVLVLRQEYRGVANVVAETAWLQNLLLELHAPLSTTTLVYCDNVSDVYLSTNHV